MKLASLLVLMAPVAMGHYMFERTIVNGVRSGVWQYIRETANNPTNSPLEDVTSNLMRCYEMPGRAAVAVQTVAAGTRVGFTSNAPMGHPGPSIFYMARVPDGQNVNTWVPSGNVWFKIDQHGHKSGVLPPFEVEMTEIYTTIPANLRPGNYLLRAEHIGLHSYQAPQFYISCAQFAVTGSGTGSPTGLVAFPGAYSKNDAGLMFNIYAGVPSSYPYPGPSVWGSGGSSPPSTPPTSPPPTVPPPTVPPPTVPPPTTPPTQPPTQPPSQPPPSGGNCAALWAQCGGQGWTGPTCCTSGTCVKSNDWYAQCLS